jgi:hypothetical protein
MLACAVLLVPACSSDEPATGGELPGASPSVLSADPGPVVVVPDDVPGAEPDSPAEPFSTPPPAEVPPATETNFLDPPCNKTGPESDALPVGDAGVGAQDAGAQDAGAPAAEQPDAAVASEPFDQAICATPADG